jgi:dienelactone hydrolase
MLARSSAKGSPITLIVYPGAYHSFDVPALQPGRLLFGYRVEYNAEAAEKAAHEVRRFLAEHMRK